jgi:hypothetical protein
MVVVVIQLEAMQAPQLAEILYLALSHLLVADMVAVKTKPVLPVVQVVVVEVEPMVHHARMLVLVLPAKEMLAQPEFHITEAAEVAEQAPQVVL